MSAWHSYKSKNLLVWLFILENRLGRLLDSNYSRACLYIPWAWIALSDRCMLTCSSKTTHGACVQKKHLFIGKQISAEINWYAGYNKVTQGWSILLKLEFLLWHWDSFVFVRVSCTSVSVSCTQVTLHVY